MDTPGELVNQSRAPGHRAGSGFAAPQQFTSFGEAGLQRSGITSSIIAVVLTACCATCSMLMPITDNG